MASETPYLHTSTAALISSEPSIEALIEKTSSSGKQGDPPVARDLHGLHDKIRDSVNRFMTKRGEVCDRSMRQLVQRRKERAQEEREREAQRAEAERAKIKREEDDKRKEKKTPSKKRSHDEMDIDEDPEVKAKRESLPNVGAHGVARQDGVGVHQGRLASIHRHHACDRNYVRARDFICASICAPSLSNRLISLTTHHVFRSTATAITNHSTRRCRTRFG